MYINTIHSFQPHPRVKIHTPWAWNLQFQPIECAILVLIERTFLNRVIKTSGPLINIMVESALYCASETVDKRMKIILRPNTVMSAFVLQIMIVIHFTMKMEDYYDWSYDNINIQCTYLHRLTTLTTRNGTQLNVCLSSPRLILINKITEARFKATCCVQ